MGEYFQRKPDITQELLTEHASLLEKDEDEVRLKIGKEGGGVLLPWLKDCEERYLSFYVTVETDHSMAMNLQVFDEENISGEAGMVPLKPAFTLRFGMLGQVRTYFCVDLNWLEGNVLFPEAEPGGLKLVCHGRRVKKNEIRKAVLATLPCHHEITVRLSQLRLSKERPEQQSLSGNAVRLVDRLGQNARKSWPGKITGCGGQEGEEILRKRLTEQLREVQAQEQPYPFENWSVYGGCKDKKLREGSGFFGRIKVNGRWWLTDPEGYAFFSVGPDCVAPGSDCRIDGMEQMLEWLPDEKDPEYGQFYRQGGKRDGGRRTCVEFDYAKANLYRAFGADWKEKWQELITGQLMLHGMNTIGNWSDQSLFDLGKMPYVTSLPKFPSTEKKIFRDFPDVFSEEYEINAAECAKALRMRKDDPYMIGYFLRNEPAWAFVDHLVLADEVLYCPERTACKEALIGELVDKYKDIASLNQAWNCSLPDFDALYDSKQKVSGWSERARDDMKAFSRKMLRAYVEIPSRACRRVDPNHMILGMRWAWISDPDIVTGWENFDVFSINCYAVDPTEAVEHVAKLGVDLPVVIGEFHFGALDAGLTATGLEGVETQHDRGMAYRYYCERVAAHPNGVGCHYFQCYDQFLLGRFDGENYNIGLFDICSQPYPEMMEQIKNCSQTLYQVADGENAPAEEKAKSIPMIAY